MSESRSASGRRTAPATPSAARSEPVSMKDIADALGVSVSIVSLALAGRAVVAEKTRRSVCEMAEKMGYRKNPMIAALMESRRRGRSLQSSPVIAYITLYDTRDGWRKWPAPNYFDGANSEAKRLGYKLETFWAMDPEMRNGRLSDILCARGIQGAIVQAPASALTKQLDFSMDWSRLSLVTVSSTLFNLNFDWVCSDHFMNMRQIVRHCIAAGRKRIALFVRYASDYSLAHRWFGSYLAEMRANGLDDTIPPFMDDSVTPVMSEERSLERITEWFERTRPEVIVGSMADVSLARLRRAGIRVPEDVSIVSCNVPEIGSDITGICESLEHVGARAVEHVVHLMHRNVTGIPESPQMLVLQGIWNEGQTFRAASAVQKKKTSKREAPRKKAVAGAVKRTGAAVGRPSRKGAATPAETKPATRKGALLKSKDEAVKSKAQAVSAKAEKPSKTAKHKSTATTATVVRKRAKTR